MLSQLTDETEILKLRNERKKTEVLSNIGLAIKRLLSKSKDGDKIIERLDRENKASIWHDP